MKPARRRLGTGPTTTRTTTAPAPASRLLPAERGESAADGEHQAVAGPPGGRRILGHGTAHPAR
ncbi:hypothetical protein [Streptomyces sp. NPDC057910]|uniref:hypothetical protein n=1 Tax=Streptomyces sp. NPDC057910 TaxID=3346278 RepID=UPI0036E323CD